jgi:large subunit ribosomal protein L4
MSIVNIYNTKNEKVGEIGLNPQIFNVEVKEHLLHDVVRMQLAAKRAGNACTKTRVEVSGGGSKPWRQKGTGRARSGSRRSPVWRGGGVVFGPKPRDYTFKLNRKVKKQALSMAMSARLQEGNLMVLDAFQMDAIKTQDFMKVMNLLQLDNCIIITNDNVDILHKSSRNANGYKVISVDGLNVYDILLHKKLVLVQPVIDSLEKRLMS